MIATDWELICKWSKAYIFALILATNIETNKCPPEMAYLSPLGAYWNEYGSGVITINIGCKYHSLIRNGVDGTNIIIMYLSIAIE